MITSERNCLRISPLDNVAVALMEIPPGQPCGEAGVTARTSIPAGHKLALVDIGPDEAVIKYGEIIGHASRPIAPGDHVHLDNVTMKRSAATRCGVGKAADLPQQVREARSFDGYLRPDGRAGTRNYIGVIATVSCSGDVAHFLSQALSERLPEHGSMVDGIVALSHDGGCCQAPQSEGMEILQRTIAGYAQHPNFAVVLLVGLGCEVNLIEHQLAAGNLVPSEKLITLSIQDTGGTEATIEQGVRAIERVLPSISGLRRQPFSLEHLCVGLECGGSDGYSGITANPALGGAVDMLVHHGGTAILSETPEIYGAEHLLIQRARTPDVSAALAERIKWWERYAARHGAEINNNPTPGNKAGGITTILEKSLGAIAKGGRTPLNAVYEYGQRVEEKGLVFMDTPGYDVVSITGMIAGGANLICFTTGRGSVCGFRPVPTLKLASNSTMYHHLEGDMDINCGTVLEGHQDLAQVAATIFEQMIATASGKATKSEELGFGTTEFVPWQMGAIL